RSGRSAAEERFDGVSRSFGFRADATKMRRERLIESVEIAFPVHEERTGQAVKTVERAAVEAQRHPLRERHELFGTDLQLPLAKLVEERDEERAHRSGN